MKQTNFFVISVKGTSNLVTKYAVNIFQGRWVTELIVHLWLPHLLHHH
jgi:hypothetical protein